MTSNSLKYLDKIYNLLNDEIGSVKNSTTSENNSENNNPSVDSERILQYLTLSVLTAEYYTDTFMSRIEAIKNLLESFKRENINATINTKSLALEHLINEIQETKCLYYYSEFKNELDSSLGNKPKIFIESKYVKYLNDKQIKENKDIWLLNANLYLAKLDEGYICNKETLTELIVLSTKLNNWVEESTININTGDTQGISGVEPYYNIKLITEHKFIFLIYKLLLRFEKTLHKEFVITNESNYNTTDLEIANIESKYSIEDIKNQYEMQGSTNNKYIEKFKESIYKIYPDKPEQSLSILHPRIFADLQNIIDKDEVTVLDIHYLFKIVKYNASELNSSEKYDEIVKLLERLEKKYLNCCGVNVDSTNKYSNFTALHLVKNTIHRLYLNKRIKIISESKSIDEINQNLKDITSYVQSKSENLLDKYMDEENNISSNKFNPAFQLGTIIGGSCKELLETFINKVENNEIDIYDEKFSELLNKVREFISKSISHLENCIDNIEEVKEKKVLPIYIHLDECKISIPEIYLDKQNEIKEENVTIFLDSAYVLPSNYDFLYKCIRGRYISKIRNFEFALNNVINKSYSINSESRLQKKLKESSKHNKESLDEFKIKSKEEFDKLFKENQITSIQIIALYASFITFVLGSISIVPKFEVSYRNLLLFMLVFSTSLCLFLFMLRILISNKDEKYNNFGEIFGVYNTESNSNNSKYYFKRELIVFIFFVTLLFFTLFLLWKNRQSDNKYIRKSVNKNYIIKPKKDVLRKEMRDTIHYFETIEESNFLPKSDEK